MKYATNQHQTLYYKNLLLMRIKRIMWKTHNLLFLLTGHIKEWASSDKLKDLQSHKECISAVRQIFRQSCFGLPQQGIHFMSGSQPGWLIPRSLSTRDRYQSWTNMCVPGTKKYQLLVAYISIYFGMRTDVNIDRMMQNSSRRRAGK